MCWGSYLTTFCTGSHLTWNGTLSHLVVVQKLCWHRLRFLWVERNSWYPNSLVTKKGTRQAVALIFAGMWSCHHCSFQRSMLQVNVHFSLREACCISKFLALSTQVDLLWLQLEHISHVAPSLRASVRPLRVKEGIAHIRSSTIYGLWSIVPFLLFCCLSGIFFFPFLGKKVLFTSSWFHLVAFVFAVLFD